MPKAGYLVVLLSAVIVMLDCPGGDHGIVPGAGLEWVTLAGGTYSMGGDHEPDDPSLTVAAT